MTDTTGDLRRAFVGDRDNYSFPDCCVVCMAPATERRNLHASETVRQILSSEHTATLSRVSYRDVPHVLTVEAVPYCHEHSPQNGQQPALASHGLRVTARRACTNHKVPEEPKIKVDKVVFEFANPEYAAQFRALSSLSTPSEHRREQRQQATETARDLAAAAATAFPKLFQRDTWAKARLNARGN